MSRSIPQSDIERIARDGLTGAIDNMDIAIALVEAEDITRAQILRFLREAQKRNHERLRELDGLAAGRFIAVSVHG